MPESVLATLDPGEDWAARYRRVRQASLDLTRGLTPEDQQVQSMPDVSPTKWHLAHVTWFFETFLLAPHLPGYRLFDPAFGFLFNSYYDHVGERHPRPERGLLTRPALPQVLDYRRYVDAAMIPLLEDQGDALADLVELGLHHEQQHQELILMDIQHVFSRNVLRPAYRDGAPPACAPEPMAWRRFAGGLAEIGAEEGQGFRFDNEGPRHKAWLEPFALAARPVTAGEWLQFVEDGGYGRPELWLSDGWAAAQREGWSAPLYWRRDGGAWRVFGLWGDQPLDPHAPVQHISHYEADAYARWAGRRLPTEAEWETAMQRPDLAASIGRGWEWTASPYVAYPRYRPPEGAIGEYNGKFMSGQMVLRGEAPATPEGHARLSYRNFFPPGARWAFSTVRLADDA